MTNRSPKADDHALNLFFYPGKTPRRAFHGTKTRFPLIFRIAGCLLATLSTVNPAAGQPPASITFARDVAPIFQAQCQSCHRPGDIGPFSLLTYEEARPWAKAIKAAVQNREMPPWGAERGVGHWKDERTLTPDEIATIVAWVDQGSSLGNPDDLPEPITFAEDGWKLGRPDVALYPPAPFRVAADVEDTYRCFVLDPDIYEDGWVEGVEFDIDNKSIAHHILVYADKDQRYREDDEADPAPGFECTMENVTVLGTKSYIGGWTPSAEPLQLPEGTAVRLRDDADVILQIHYHNSTGEDQFDQTGLGLHFSRGTIQKHSMGTIVAATRGFLVPPGEPNYESRAQLRIPADISIFAFRPHMHYLGKDMKLTAVDPDGQIRELISVPHYNFDWQLTYMAEEPIRLKKGTVIKMVAHHDNSAANPFNPNDPPIEVRWGPRSVDEMCHAWFFYTVDEEALDKEPDPIWQVLGVQRAGKNWLESWFED